MLVHELLFLPVAADTAVHSRVVDNLVALGDAVFFSDTQLS
jgi:hypothetical protein